MHNDFMNRKLVLSNNQFLDFFRNKILRTSVFHVSLLYSIVIILLQSIILYVVRSLI
jgi:hypothetical protein